MEPLRFHDNDVSHAPAPGWYPSTIVTACWRQSTRDNRMVYLVHALEGVPPTFSRISDCFVLEGASPQGLAYARKRLVAVFRACGSDPQTGDEICPAVLSNACLEVKVAHESWKNTVRLQVVGYRVHSDLPVKVGDPDAGTPPCAGVQGGGGSHG